MNTNTVKQKNTENGGKPALLLANEQTGEKFFTHPL